MTKKLKKLLSVVLAVSMAMSLLNVTAFADNGGGSAQQGGETAQTVGIGGTLTLDEPSGVFEAADEGVEAAEPAWVSSNEAVATVVDGVVTGVAAGEATITLTEYRYLWTDPDGNEAADAVYYEWNAIDGVDSSKLQLVVRTTTWTIEVENPAPTVLKVDADAAEEGTYTTIQDAIAYIVANKDEAQNWLIEVAEGTYGRFLVPHGVSNITIQGAGDGTVVTTLDGSSLENITDKEKHGSGSQGIVIWGANITLKDMKITSGGSTNDVWYAAAVSTLDTDRGAAEEVAAPVILDNITFAGAGVGFAVMPDRNTFTVNNCTIDNYKQAIYFAGDNYTANDCHITNNTISNCVYAIHGYYGKGEASTAMEIRGNTISGTADRFAVIAILDQSNTGAVKLNIVDNTFSYTIVGGINQRDHGVDMEAVMDSNTMNDYSYAVDAYWYSVEDYGTIFYAPKQEGKIATWYGNPTTEAGEATQDLIQQALEEYGTAGQVIEINAPAQEMFTIAKNAIVIQEYVDAGDLTIKKTVEGNDRDKTEFSFTVELTRADGKQLNGRYDWICSDGSVGTSTLEDGKLTVTAKAGQSVTIKDLLPGTQYAVTENEAQGYTSLATSGTTGTIVAKETQTVSFVNTYIPVEIPAEPSVEWETSKSKTATNLDENYESKVTLSLPAADYKPAVDVVMVIDVSSSMKEKDIEEAQTAALAMCDELASKTNVDVNVGIVTFDRTAHELTDGLVDINAAKAAVNTIAASSDTNMMAGLIAGKAMLETGSAEEQYLVLMSDGIPIYWVNEEGDPVCKVLELYKKDGTTLQGTMNLGTDPEGSWDYAELADRFDRMMSMEEILAADWENDSDIQKQISDTGEILNADECKYTNIQKSTYMTAKYLLEEIIGQYQVEMVAFGTDKYNLNGQDNNVVYKYGENFCDWIGGQDGVSYYKVAKPGYGGEEGQLTKAFKSIANEVIQLVDAGSVVIDEIGETSDYNFDFVNDIEKLTLTEGVDEDGKPIVLDKEKLDDNTYGFGKQDDGTYKFVVTYYADGFAYRGHQYGECFVWDINVPVTIDKLVQLTYSVKLTNPKTEANTYGQYDADGSKGYDGLYTNNSATLYPVDSNGTAGDPEEFQKPTVSYTVTTTPPADDITYKVVHEYYDADGKLVGSTEETYTVQPNTVIKAEDIERVTTYDGNTYTFTSSDKESITVTAGGDNTITLTYKQTADTPHRPTGGGGGGGGGTITPPAKDPDVKPPVVDEPVIDEPVVDPVSPAAPDAPAADVPATGDLSMLWVAAALFSAAGLILLSTFGTKRKDEEA